MTPAQLAIERSTKLKYHEDKLFRMRVSTKSEVATLMHSMRKMSGIPLRECARRMGCSAPFLSDMENGRRTQSIEWIEKLEKALK